MFVMKVYHNKLEFVRLYVKSTHFRGKIFLTISDSNNILQACWVSLGSDIKMDQ
jgi:hypothetical protein